MSRNGNTRTRPKRRKSVNSVLGDALKKAASDNPDSTLAKQVESAKMKDEHRAEFNKKKRSFSNKKNRRNKKKKRKGGVKRGSQTHSGVAQRSTTRHGSQGKPVVTHTQVKASSHKIPTVKKRLLPPKPPVINKPRTPDPLVWSDDTIPVQATKKGVYPFIGYSKEWV